MIGRQYDTPRSIELSGLALATCEYYGVNSHVKQAIISGCLGPVVGEMFWEYYWRSKKKGAYSFEPFIENPNRFRYVIRKKHMKNDLSSFTLAENEIIDGISTDAGNICKQKMREILKAYNEDNYEKIYHSYKELNRLVSNIIDIADSLGEGTCFYYQGEDNKIVPLLESSDISSEEKEGGRETI